MVSDELQSVSLMEQIMSYLSTLQSDAQKVEEGESQSQTPSFPFSTSSSESFNGRLTFTPLFLPFVGRQDRATGGRRFQASMDLDVEPGDDAKGIRIFPLKEATDWDEGLRNLLTRNQCRGLLKSLHTSDISF